MATLCVWKVLTRRPSVTVGPTADELASPDSWHLYMLSKPVPIYPPRRDERLGWPEHVRVNILPKDVTNRPIWQGLDSNPDIRVSSPAQ